MKSLKNRIPRPVGWNARRDCAVVIPIIREQGQYAVLFERREKSAFPEAAWNQGRALGRRLSGSCQRSF